MPHNRASASSRSDHHIAPLFRPSTTAVYWPVTPRDPGSNPGGGAASSARFRAVEGVDSGLSDGFRALPCKQSHGSSTLHSSTEWADCQGLTPIRLISDGGFVRVSLRTSCPFVCECRPTAKTPVFQTGDVGSIPSARTQPSLRWWNRNTRQPQKLGPEGRAGSIPALSTTDANSNA